MCVISSNVSWTVCSDALAPVKSSIIKLTTNTDNAPNHYSNTVPITETLANVKNQSRSQSVGSKINAVTKMKTWSEYTAFVREKVWSGLLLSLIDVWLMGLRLAYKLNNSELWSWYAKAAAQKSASVALCRTPTLTASHSQSSESCAASHDTFLQLYEMDSTITASSSHTVAHALPHPTCSLTHGYICAALRGGCFVCRRAKKHRDFPHPCRTRPPPSLMLPSMQHTQNSE